MLRRSSLRRLSRTLDRGLHCVFLSILAPATSMYFFYYHFRTVYTTNVFSADGFQQQYTSGVYRWVVLAAVAIAAAPGIAFGIYPAHRGARLQPDRRTSVRVTRRFPATERLL